MENEKQIMQLLTGLTETVGNLTETVTNLSKTIGKMDSRFDKIESRLDKMDTKFERIENRIDKIEIHLENTVIPRIQLIAESHIDLSRKLDSAIEQRLEREMLKMRVELLESDMKRYKMQG